MSGSRRITTAQLSTFAALALVLTLAGAAGAGIRHIATAGEIPSCEADPTQEPSPRPEDFDPAAFSDPTTIDNQWLPFVPGTRFTLKGFADRGNGILPHRVVLTVTDLTKVIDGVRTVVLWDQDINDGQLVEAELAFQAQDDVGNVWNFGEYPEEFEDGAFVGAPSTWIAGLSSAEAGVHMLADPRVETAAYLQGWAPDVEFADCGQVLKTGLRVCVTLDCYDNASSIDEWDLLEPEGGHQRKFYASGVGNIQVGAVDDPEGEILELVKVAQLTPEAMADVRAEIRRLEQRAYQVSELYRQTPPVEGPDGEDPTYRVAGFGHSDYGSDDVRVDLDIAGGTAFPLGFAAYRDSRANPPGFPSRSFFCNPDDILFTSADLVAPNTLRLSGRIDCWGVSTERSFVLKIIDKGTNPPTRDRYRMILFNGRGDVLYDWADRTTLRRGDIAIAPVAN